MSSAVTEVNDTSDVPSGTWEKSGSGAPSVLDLTALTFSKKKRLNLSTVMHELAGGRPRPNSWLTDLHSFLGDSRSRSTVIAPERTALHLAKVTIAASLSVPVSFGIVNTSRRTGVVLCSLQPTCRTIGTFKSASAALGFEAVVIEPRVR